MKWIKSNLIPIIITVLFSSIVGLLGTLYAQQNEKIDKLEEEKANKEQVIFLLKELKENRKEDRQEQQAERTEQKALNKELVETLNRLNTQIIILNEKLKKWTKQTL